MNCSEFRQRSAELLTPSSSLSKREECEAHLSECLDCLDFYLNADTAQASEITEENALNTQIIQALGINSCTEAEALMADYCGAQQEGFQESLVRVHLENCSDCSAMYASYMSLSSELAALRELAPSENLTETILKKTLSRAQRIQRLFRRWQGRFSILLQRPRFTMEASMFGTLVWMVTFGIPAGAIDRDDAGTGVMTAFEAGAYSAQRGLVAVGANLTTSLGRVQPLLREGVNTVEDNSLNLLRERFEITLSQGDQLLRRAEKLTE